MQSQEIIFFLDKIGILAFAFTAVSDGVRKKLDVFGLSVVGILSAIGGGIIRDLLLAKEPYAISNIDYLVFAFGVTAFSILIFYFKLKIPSKILIIAETLGLSVFAAAGATVSLNLNLSIFHTIIFAVITASGGGVIKDILINEVPFILRRDVYATSAGFGGIIIHLLHLTGTNLSNSVIIGILCVICFRFYSLRRRLHLPIIKID